MLRSHTNKRGFATRMIDLFRTRRSGRTVPARGRRLSLEPLETRTLLAIVSMSVDENPCTVVEREGGSCVLTFSVEAEEGENLQQAGDVRVFYSVSGLEEYEYWDSGCPDGGNVLIMASAEQYSATVTVTFLNDAIADDHKLCEIALTGAESADPFGGGGGECCCGGGECCGGGGGGCCGISYTIAENQPTATVTILDDDAWAIQVEADSPNEIAERDGVSGYTISRVDDGTGRSGDTTYAIAVDFTMAGDADYGLTNGLGGMLSPSWNEDTDQWEWHVTMPAGGGGVEVGLQSHNDAVKESDADVTLSIVSAKSVNGAGCFCGSLYYGPDGTYGQTGPEATVTILDDDHWAIEVERTSAETIVERGPGDVGFTVTRVDDGTGRSGDLSYGVLVDLAMSGLAEQYTDYNLSDDGGYLAIYGDKTVIEDGDTTATLKLTPENDHKREPDEDAVISVENGTSFGLTGGVYGADPSQGSDSVTILDDDWWKVGIAASAGDVAEPDDDSWAMYDGKFTLTRTKDRDVAYEMDTSYALQVKVQISVPDPLADPQTIATYGVDYSLCPGTVYEGENPGELFATFVIPQGATTEPIDMSVWNDAKPEENEEVTLAVVGPAPGAGDPQFNVDGAAASATVTIEDNDHWSVTFERGAPSGSEPNAIERLPGVVQDYGYYRATRFDANPGDDYKASDRTYPISLTFETTGTATFNSDYTFTALADTVPGGDLEVIGGPTQGSPVVHGGVTYDTWATSIPIGLSESYVRVNPIFDWLDEGEPGNRSAAADPDDEANHGEYIDGSLVTAGWSGKPSTYDAVVPTPAEKKRVVIHDGGIIRARTDSDNDGDLDADDDEKEKDANSLGRVIMVNNDQDGANENDRAQTTFYVWLDSLTPEAAPVLVDVYVPNALKLKMWDAAAGGAELPFGQDVNPADGRMDEGTRLVTLDATTTSYDETVYVEATDYDAGRLTLNLCADVVSGGPDGSDPTYYTTLKIDALAMAFNHDPADNSGADGLNLRSSYTAGTEHAAPEWVTGPALPYPSPRPNDGLVEQNTVLYLAGQTVTVGGRIVVDTKYEGMAIKIEATVTGGAIGGLGEVTFIVNANGVLEPQAPATGKAVNGVDDFALFDASNPTSTVIRREEARFYWEITYIGASITEGNATGSNEAVVTDPVLMYTVLGVCSPSPMWTWIPQLGCARPPALRSFRTSSWTVSMSSQWQMGLTTSVCRSQVSAMEESETTFQARPCGSRAMRVS